MSESFRRLAKLIQSNGPSVLDKNRVTLAEVSSVDPLSVSPSGTTMEFYEEDVIWTTTADALKAGLQEGDSLLVYFMDDVYIVIDKIEK